MTVATSDIQLPKLPDSQYAPTNDLTTFVDAGIIHPDQFTRKNLRAIIHIITQDLKKRGTKTSYIFLPFRSKVNDYKLEEALTILFPKGQLINCEDNDAYVESLLSNFNEFTLVSILKYIWSRLPNNEIIGWDVYLEFKRREKEQGYPKKAFLTIMPKCLSSPAHASIVYDFLDLLLGIISNSQYNYLSGRKISKMASFWAFNPMKRSLTSQQEFDFIEGIEMWRNSTNALFHLVLSFLRSMLPENDMETIKLPKALQSLLVSNQYPPSDEKEALRDMITIPCVSLETTIPSKDPFELIEKVTKNLSFDKKDAFLSIENYTILKNIFSKKSTKEIVGTLTDESQRIIGRLTSKPIQSNYNLYPGWYVRSEEEEEDSNKPIHSKITIRDVSIQDYYIWTWLASLSSDQPSKAKQLFGRSLVVEANLLGFQKWIVITEKTMHIEEDTKLKIHQKHITMDYKRDTLPPLPPPVPVEKDHQKPPPPPVEKDNFKSNVLPPIPQEDQNTPNLTSSHTFAPPKIYHFDDDDDFSDQSFSDEFSYIFSSKSLLSIDPNETKLSEPSKPLPEIAQEQDAHQAPLVSSRDISSAYRFLKSTPEVIPKTKNPVVRKAPPTLLDPEVIMKAEAKKSNMVQGGNEKRDSDDSINASYEAYHAAAERQKSSIKDNNYYGRGERILPSPESQISASSQLSEEVIKKQQKTEEKQVDEEQFKKGQKKAQLAQIAAATAAGFPFAFLLSDKPPPPPEKAVETARAVSDMLKTTPFIIQVPETSLKNIIESTIEMELPPSQQSSGENSDLTIIQDSSISVADSPSPPPPPPPPKDTSMITTPKRSAKRLIVPELPPPNLDLSPPRMDIESNSMGFVASPIPDVIDQFPSANRTSHGSSSTDEKSYISYSPPKSPQRRSYSPRSPSPPMSPEHHRLQQGHKVQSSPDESPESYTTANSGSPEKLLPAPMGGQMIPKRRSGVPAGYFGPQQLPLSQQYQSHPATPQQQHQQQQVPPRRRYSGVPPGFVSPPVQQQHQQQQQGGYLGPATPHPKASVPIGYSMSTPPQPGYMTTPPLPRAASPSRDQIHYVYPHQQPAGYRPNGSNMNAFLLAYMQPPPAMMGRSGSPFKTVPHPQYPQQQQQQHQQHPYQYGSPKYNSASSPSLRGGAGGLRLPSMQRRNVSGGNVQRVGGMGGAGGADMYMIPVGGKHNKNTNVNKADLRSAFISGSFGI